MTATEAACVACGCPGMEPWISVRRTDRRATATVYRLDRCRSCGTAVTVGRSRGDATGLYRGGAYARPPAVVDLLLEPLRRLGQAAVLRALGPLAPGARVIVRVCVTTAW